jgi:hypothetical protein
MVGEEIWEILAQYEKIIIDILLRWRKLKNIL